jgi:hypothetical protein
MDAQATGLAPLDRQVEVGLRGIQRIELMAIGVIRGVIKGLPRHPIVAKTVAATQAGNL